MLQNNEDPNLLTTTEVKDMLKTTLPKVYRLIQNGKLKAINIGAGVIRNDWRIKREDLEEFLKNGTPVVK